MKHSGLSGYGLKKHRGVVRKWTTGEESSLALRSDFLKQLKELMCNSLAPIKTVDIIGYMHDGDKFYFDMPYIEADSVFTSKGDLKKEKDLIRQSLSNRSKEEMSGFRALVKSEIKILLTQIPESERYVGENIIKNLDRCPDTYPIGYCHGDFGFANMLTVNGQIFMLDFTKSFIKTPLMDIATMDLSLSGDKADDRHHDIVKTVRNDFKHNRSQIDVLKKVKMLSWLPHAGDMAWRKRLIKMLND